MSGLLNREKAATAVPLIKNPERLPKWLFVFVSL